MAIFCLWSERARAREGRTQARGVYRIWCAVDSRHFLGGYFLHEKLRTKNTRTMIAGFILVAHPLHPLPGTGKSNEAEIYVPLGVTELNYNGHTSEAHFSTINWQYGRKRSEQRGDRNAEDNISDNTNDDGSHFPRMEVKHAQSMDGGGGGARGEGLHALRSLPRLSDLVSFEVDLCRRISKHGIPFGSRVCIYGCTDLWRLVVDDVYPLGESSLDRRRRRGERATGKGRRELILNGRGERGGGGGGRASAFS